MADKQTPIAYWVSLGFAAFMVVLDQATKLLVIKHLRVEQDRISVIPNFFDLVHVQNRGAAWGMMQNQTLFLSGISIIMLVLILLFRRSILENTLTHFFIFGLLIGGIIGNLIDRLKFGYVTDFFEVYVGDLRWPVFNVADSAICIAVTLYLITTWRTPVKAPHPVDEKA